MAIGALAAQPGCASVIAGATSADQVKANAAAADWIPSDRELAELDRLVPLLIMARTVAGRAQPRDTASL